MDGLTYSMTAATMRLVAGAARRAGLDSIKATVDVTQPKLPTAYANSA